MMIGVLSCRRARCRVLRWLVSGASVCLSVPASGQSLSSLNLLKPVAEDRAKVDVFWGARRDFARGRLLEVSDSMLVLEGRGGRHEVPASDVREVWSPGGARYRKPLIVGTSIGLGLGLLAKAGEGDCNDPTSLCATDGPTRGSDIAIVTALGAASGLGWAWWKRHPRHLLYLAPDAVAEVARSLGEPEVRAPVRPDWLALEKLQGGTVEVAQRGGSTTLQGSLISITPEAALLLVDGEPYVIRQPEVRRLWSEPRVGWWRAGIAALYQGAIWGALIAAAACNSDRNEWTECDTRAWATTTGIFGALYTYGVARQRHDALVYDSSRPVQVPRTTLTLQPVLAPHAVGVRGALTF